MWNIHRPYCRHPSVSSPFLYVRGFLTETGATERYVRIDTMEEVWNDPEVPGGNLRHRLNDRSPVGGQGLNETEDQRFHEQMDAFRRAYDREFTVIVYRYARRRVGFDTDQGNVVRFVVQLEYFHDGCWWEVVRYDHDGTGGGCFTHDVTEEGLHIDVFRYGRKVTTEYISPPIPAAVALNLAEEHLTQNVEYFLDRFKRWHESTER